MAADHLAEAVTPEEADALRAPFPPEAIGQLPKAGIKLDYVGHAAVTDRLLAVDPDWSWEPYAVNERGTPQIVYGDTDAVLWIRLTVSGVTRPGVGIVRGGAFELEKQLISDALRNAAMRFGVALDLWSKEDLRPEDEGSHPAGNSTQGSACPTLTPDNSGAAPISKHRVQKLKARASALTAAGVSLAEHRQSRVLPPIAASTVEELDEWDRLLDELEVEAAAIPVTTAGQVSPASALSTSTEDTHASEGDTAAVTNDGPAAGIGKVAGRQPVLLPEDFPYIEKVTVDGQRL